MTAATALIPYPGLRPFEPADNEIFCGQDENITALYERLGDSRFVAVLGESGAGKSSLVSAGLIPRLKNIEKNGLYRWHIIRLNPEMFPMERLARACSTGLSPAAASNPSLAESQTKENITTLRAGLDGLSKLLRQHQDSQPSPESSPQPESRLDSFPVNAGPQPFYLILVDQFEELFRFRRKSSSRRRNDDSALFVKLLLDAAQHPRLNAYVVPTMRSEYIGDCAEFYGLSKAINDGLFLLPRMTRLQCEEAILEPLQIDEAKPVTITPELIQQLLNETEEQEDGLPLLQHALRWLYDKLKGGARALTLPAEYAQYLEAVRQAETESTTKATKADRRFVAWCLNKQLDDLYAGLPTDAHRAAAEKIFTLLAERDPKGRLIRRVARWKKLLKVDPNHPEIVRKVVDTFRDAATARCFLRPFLNAGEDLEKDDTVDLSHEVLPRRWNRYGKWIDEETDRRRRFLRLAELADEYYTGPVDALKVSGKGDVLRGARLDDLLRWQKEQKPTPAWAERYLGDKDDTLGRRRYELDPALRFLGRSQWYSFGRRALTWFVIVLAMAATVLAPSLYFRERKNRLQLQLNVAQAETSKKQAQLAEFETTTKSNELSLTQEHLSQVTKLNGQLNTALDQRSAALAQETRYRNIAEVAEKHAVAVGIKLQDLTEELDQRRRVAEDGNKQKTAELAASKTVNNVMGDIYTALKHSDEQQEFAWTADSESRNHLRKNTLASLETVSNAAKTIDTSVQGLLDYAAPVLAQRAANILELNLLTDHRLNAGDAGHSDVALLTGEAARTRTFRAQGPPAPPSATERLIALKDATFLGLAFAVSEYSPNSDPVPLGYPVGIVSFQLEGRGRTQAGRFVAGLLGRKTLPFQGASAISEDGKQIAVSDDTGRVLVVAPYIAWASNFIPLKSAAGATSVKTVAPDGDPSDQYSEHLRFTRTANFETSLHNPDSLTYSHNGRFLLLGAPGKWVLWSKDSGQIVAKAPIPNDISHENRQKRSILYAAISDDGKHITTELGYGSDFENTSLQKWTIVGDKGMPEAKYTARFRLLGGSGNLLLVADHTCLYTLPNDESTRRTRQQCYPSPILFADYDPESELIASTDGDKLVIFKTGRAQEALLELQLRNVFRDGITGLRFTQNGQKLITSFGPDIRLWDIQALTDAGSTNARLAALLVQLRTWKPDEKDQQKTSESLAKLVKEAREFVPALKDAGTEH